MTARLKGFTADHFGLRRPRTARARRRPR
jgi:hypothetical protein